MNNQDRKRSDYDIYNVMQDIRAGGGIKALLSAMQISPNTFIKRLEDNRFKTREMNAIMEFLHMDSTEANIVFFKEWYDKLDATKKY